jgi:hypothetical protein
MDGAFSFNCGDPLFIISKAPPGAKSDKKLMKFLVYWKYSASSAAPESGANLQAGRKLLFSAHGEKGCCSKR